MDKNKIRQLADYAINECCDHSEDCYWTISYLEAKEIPTPAGCSVWRQETIRSILSNEKYKGDAIINKTYVSDCISKRVKANNGERNKYYIENNHPAIIDAGTFARVQEEIVRRSGKPKVKQKGTKTELSRYSSKYALSELLICGECRTPYRRCTWTAKGKRKIVWRCINRLDYGKKYCHHSPSIEESLLQDAVMRAIMQTAKQGNDGRLFGHGETGKGLYPNPTLRGERYLSKQKDTPYRNGRECFLCI